MSYKELKTNLSIYIYIYIIFITVHKHGYLCNNLKFYIFQSNRLDLLSLLPALLPPAISLKNLNRGYLVTM